MEQIIKKRGGIVYADREGFSIEHGFQITCEFDADATGEWTMALLDANEHWITFRVDLGNKEHREAFCEGRIPPGLQTWDAGPARML
jgi:hypothetical protein